MSKGQRLRKAAVVSDSSLYVYLANAIFLSVKSVSIPSNNLVTIGYYSFICFFCSSEGLEQQQTDGVFCHWICRKLRNKQIKTMYE